MLDLVISETVGRLTVLTLNQPQTGNALSGALVASIEAKLDAIVPEACDTIVFRGAGKGFCGGLDLSNLEAETDDSLFARLVRIEILLQRIARLPQMTIALVHRFAFGAGADLAVACRRRIAAPGTRFAFPGVRFGIALGTGRLARCVGPDRAREFLSRKTPIEHDEALEGGLLTQSLDEPHWPQLIARSGMQCSALDARMACIVTERLASGCDDSDLAALVRSAAPNGLRNRIEQYVTQTKASCGE
ncbi:enoyl-CoA hydratase/isomerase family protein [Bradyrhizobium mercantei]|uniref:enoyl-CoA hydratase/isomerase family protein n=1 Tax=Bradyrhizobium mercantei TaxID=1904807 RepID=UPI0009779FD0|nr:enoyl-CoA hydratase/isomerase family protein [Bradyrhizobium mercantei]